VATRLYGCPRGSSAGTHRTLWPVTRGLLTLVHFSAQRECFLRDSGRSMVVHGVFKGGLGSVEGHEGCLGCILWVRTGSG